MPDGGPGFPPAPIPATNARTRAGGVGVGGRRARKKQKQKQRQKKAAKGRARVRSGAPARPRATAATSDKYDLYQRAVQSPQDDVEFLAKLSGRRQTRAATHLREDFCGTALLASHWIRHKPDHTAEGFDNDPEPVAWGLAHNFDPHGIGERMRFHVEDVRKPSHRRPDLRVAFNFSY